jgi:hypothetical protein
MSLVFVAEGRADTSRERSRRSGAVPDPLGPTTRAGRKLARLLDVDSVPESYVTIALVDQWKGRARKGVAPKGVGRGYATHLATSLPKEASLVLIGRNVATAFDLGDQAYLRWRERWFGIGEGTSPAVVRRIVVVPHPQDGRWWGDDRNATKAARFFRALAREER